jgi:hypothetical protein
MHWSYRNKPRCDLFAVEPDRFARAWLIGHIVTPLRKKTGAIDDIGGKGDIRPECRRLARHSLFW